MRSFPALILIAVVVAAPLALAAPKLPVGVNDCDGGNVCVIAETDPACVGAGFGLQGVVACATTECVTLRYGISREDVCFTFAGPGIVGVNNCNGSNVCVIAKTDPACVGVGFGLQGVATCASDGCIHVIYGFNRESVCLA